MTDKPDIATLIHDARKPLNHISMHAELIKILSQKPGSEAEIQQSADDIIKASKACSELLQTLMTQD
ncbi:histidine kinase [Pseudoalteromonas sp. R3]|uniref:histidine kinase n=1 Tax=Pseudoalteromonas sp. R3 TaxID=1709477 RepID=UPI0006B44DAF|nr:histidine kinase [Pseudoalteromonas sp. R3]AZZ96490.1 histidine kinase [Pseudoalteromonas sp. R3]